MTWKEAKDHARQAFDLAGEQNKARGFDWPACLNGAKVPLADYQDEADLRLLKPEEPALTLNDQRLINRAFARLVTKHHGRPIMVMVRTVERR